MLKRGYTKYVAANEGHLGIGRSAWWHVPCTVRCQTASCEILGFKQIVLFFPSTVSPIVPSNYLYPSAETVSVNGSSQDGKCSSTPNFINRCEDPTSSVLFDGNIPTLTGLDGDMWASQLLTVQIRQPSGIEIISDFAGGSGVERVELVMFNCPEWGIAVQNIGIWRATSISSTRKLVGTISPAITSCNSLVRVCISSLAITDLLIYLQFFPAPDSNRTYLAEVEFYQDNATCRQDAIITTPLLQDDTITPPPDTTTLPPSDLPSDTTTPRPPLPYNTIARPQDSMSSSTIAIAASIGCVVLLIVCLLAAVLILWRCYYVKHYKHNTSPHPAVGEGHINTHSHPPPVTLCEETGQVYYSTPQEVVPQESNDTYSHIHHDTFTGRGAIKKSREDTVAKDVEMGEYSMLSYGGKPLEQDVGTYPGSKVGERQGKKRKKESKKVSADATVDQLYAQVDKKKKKDGDTTHPHPPEDDTPVDQLYASVDKKKKDGDTTHPHPPEDDTPVDQLYAQVDKKKKEDGDTTHPHPPEDDTPMDQLYAQVDKKKDGETHLLEADTPVDQLYDKKNKEACEDSPQESGAVYSVVSKPHPPQVPAKSNLLMDDLYN